MLEHSHVFVPGQPYSPLVVERSVLADLDPDEVYMHASASGELKFHRNMIKEMVLKNCGNCGKFFHKSAWNKHVLQHDQKVCPFCFAPNGERLKPNEQQFNLNADEVKPMDM